MEQRIEQNVQNVENAIIEPGDAVPVDPRAHPRGHGAFLVVRDGYKVHEIEGQKRGKRCHVFDDVRSFALWLNRHASAERTQTEILVHKDSIVAALDPEDPHGDRVVCALPLHPSFLAWSNVFGRPLDQVNLHRLVIAEAEALGESAEGFSAALLQLQIATAGDFSAELDALGYMKVAGGTTRQEATVKLPPRFTVRTPIIEGVCSKYEPSEGEPYFIECRYALDVFLQLAVVGEAGSKRAQFTLSCPRLEIHQRQARRDAAAYLQALLDPEFLVGLGEVKIEAVPLIGDDGARYVAVDES